MPQLFKKAKRIAVVRTMLYNVIVKIFGRSFYIWQQNLQIYMRELNRM